MQGQQLYHFQPELISTVQLEFLVPKNHFLRKVDKLLDLGFVRTLTKKLYCEDNDRPSVDPELFIRMMLIESFCDIDSDRHLCEKIEYNLAFRWFCRPQVSDNEPDHSSLSRIRDRLDEKVFRDIFLNVVDLCLTRALCLRVSQEVSGGF